jgi:Domain of unknown function (DUF4192)
LALRLFDASADPRRVPAMTDTSDVPPVATFRGMPDAPALTIRGPGDLVDAIPYLLGFHPQRSVVLVGLARRHRVTVTARIDLADAGTSSDILTDTCSAVERGGATTLLAVIFDDDAPPTASSALPHDDVVERVLAAAASAGLVMLDAVFTVGGRWWSYLCAGEDCCPEEGVLTGGDSSAVAAAATYAGMVAMPDRAELGRVLEPEPDEQRAALLPALEVAEERELRAILDGHGDRHERSVKRAIFAAARDADATLFPGSTGVLTVQEIARLAVGLAHTGIRDAVWLAIEQRRLGGRELWRQIARRAPAPYDAPALFLFGWLEWRLGNGVLAGMAAERALASQPGYRAAELLLSALSHGLDPRRTPRLRMPKSA